MFAVSTYLVKLQLAATRWSAAASANVGGKRPSALLVEMAPSGAFASSQPEAPERSGLKLVQAAGRRLL
ncbi:hypothetical protein DOTSEDRAFT_42471 [Dothistroma septosporum NZE10]|uniref:Uncharacterized protein n=1 Tax=Dothistroma septosporum (strain NZE10 / CBS 128990) TaxID=675120 RepID=N1Q0S4_DOTSN|nr:hypothetical protein DOTSEDRAFT_42471 [Dothistroma septosporum NZE10]